MLLLLPDFHAQIEAVVVAHAESVFLATGLNFRIVNHGRIAPITIRLVGVAESIEGDGVAGAIDPGGREAHALVHIVIEHDGGVVTAVVTEREAPAAIDFIKLTPIPAQGIAQPAGEAALLFLDKKLQAVAFPIALRHFVLPVVFQAKKEAGPLFVRQHVLHISIVSLQADLIFLAKSAGSTQSRLPALLGLDAGSTRHP